MATPPTAAEPGGRFVSLAVPVDAMVLLIGVAASGKSTFARRHFAPTEILSSDALRAVITDDPPAQAATDDAFDLLHRILAMRLRRGRESLGGSLGPWKGVAAEGRAMSADQSKALVRRLVDDLNADSLDLVELIMSLEEEFGMEISDEDAERIQKVSDAVEYIEEHQQ